MVRLGSVGVRGAGSCCLRCGVLSTEGFHWKLAAPNGRGRLPDCLPAQPKRVLTTMAHPALPRSCRAWATVRSCGSTGWRWPPISQVGPASVGEAGAVVTPRRVPARHTCAWRFVGPVNSCSGCRPCLDPCRSAAPLPHLCSGGRQPARPARLPDGRAAQGQV